MTIRTALQQLHQLAAQLGADTPLRVLVTGKSSEADSFTATTHQTGTVVILKSRRWSRRRREDPDLHERQLGYQRKRWKTCRDNRLCARCKAPLEEGRVASCKGCAEFRRQKYLAKRGE